MSSVQLNQRLRYANKSLVWATNYQLTDINQATKHLSTSIRLIRCLNFSTLERQNFDAFSTTVDAFQRLFDVE